MSCYTHSPDRIQDTVGLVEFNLVHKGARVKNYLYTAQYSVCGATCGCIFTYTAANMIQMKTMLFVIDNSGARVAQCIKSLRGPMKPASVGDEACVYPIQ